MRAAEFLVENDDAIQLRIPSNQRAKAWIQKVYDQYPYTFNNNHVMAWNNNEEFVMFELVPSMTKRDAVEVKWYQAHPMGQGIGARGMAELKRLAQEDNITLTLFPWDKGQVSRAKLKRFYNKQGFKPVRKGAPSMYWEPEQLNELNIDNYRGWGQIPKNADIDYFGLRVAMKPSTFLKLSFPLRVDADDRKGIDQMKQHEKAGGAFGAPTLDITVPNEWRDGDFSTGTPKVYNHDGRHRMIAHLELYGDTPVETHIFLNSPNREWRTRYFTPEIINQLNTGGIITQNNALFSRQLFNI